VAHHGACPALGWVALAAARCVREGIPLYRRGFVRGKGKVREVHDPEPLLKEALRSLCRVVTRASRTAVNNGHGSPQYAFTPGMGIVGNAERHRENPHLLVMDIEGFFDACSWEFVRSSLEFLTPDSWWVRRAVMGEVHDPIPTPSGESVRGSLSELLRAALINPGTGGLYQGAPPSGPISNLILRPAARYLREILEKEGMTLTIYADDISVSGPEPFDARRVDRVRGAVLHAFEKFGLPFRLKESKTRVMRGCHRRVTGVAINGENELAVPRGRYRDLRAALERLSRGEEITYSPGELSGLLAFADMADRTGKVRRLIEKYRTVMEAAGIPFPGRSRGEGARS
jgi:hypothetical protein